MTYDTILFDLDGTLIDSVELIIRSYQHTLHAFGCEPASRATLIELMGIPLSATLARFAKTQSDIADMVRCYREYNLAHHDTLVLTYPDVRETLEKLKARGCALGVITSKLSADARRGLKVTGLSHLVDCVVGANDVRHAKPDREPVLRGLALLNAAPDTALMVGDSVYDLRAGRAASVRTGAALWGPCEASTLLLEAPDHAFSRIRQVAEH